MKKEFIIKGWTPFDLLSISKDEFYNVVNQEYYKQFNKNIDITYMELSFLSKDVHVKMLNFARVLSEKSASFHSPCLAPKNLVVQ